jgi:hypothetical protein
MSNEAQETTVNATTGEKTFTLPSGKVAVIKKGKGLHARKAMQQADGDGSKYLGSLMAQLITIDGVGIVPEDLDDMDLQDYMALQAEFADQNFTLPQGT